MALAWKSILLLKLVTSRTPISGSLRPSRYKTYPTAITRKGRELEHIKLCCFTHSGSAATNEVEKIYLDLTDEELMKQCEMGTFKASGPGGQHRNKRESAVRLKHVPTGIISQAVEDRSQHKNRASALKRLRTLLALKVRNTVDLSLKSFFKFFLPSQLSEDQILFLTQSEEDYITLWYHFLMEGMKALLDLLFAVNGSVSEAAKLLGLSTGALSRLILSDDSLRMAVNDLRMSKGLKPLK